MSQRPRRRSTVAQAHPRDGHVVPAAAAVAAGLLAVAVLLAVVAGSPGSPGRTPPGLLALASPTGGGSGGPTGPLAPTPGATSTVAPPAAAIPTGTPAGTPAGTPTPAATTPFPGGLLIADRGNGRLLVLDPQGRIAWTFPRAGSLPPGQAFAADDAFIAPDGRTIVVNDESHQVIDRIDIATRRVVWQYGHYDRAGSALGFLHTPDDAYPLANGDVVVADIANCRVLQIAPDRSIVRQWGRTGVCRAGAPTTLDQPNGDTPLPDGGLLITEIVGSRVVRLAPDGHVVFDIHVPVAYPSDAQLDAAGNVVVADFSNPGQVVAVSPSGKLVWRYRPTSGPGELNHPSLATPLASGLVSVNDDFHQRIVVIDPSAGTIVWQYGRTGVAGRAVGRLSDPDGHQPLPVGLFPF